MSKGPLNLKTLWAQLKFTPTDNQIDAIFHNKGPLFLQAGPGSGKTRVLLWRTVNLIVNEGIPPDEIFLSTFTEKAALQLKEGLRSLLDMASSYTGKPYDTAKMYIGTIHSLCLSILGDRRFTPERVRPKTPILLDDLGQYFHINNKKFWEKVAACKALQPEPNTVINALLDPRPSNSKHKAVETVISIFNRISEECLDPDHLIKESKDPVFKAICGLYKDYLDSLIGTNQTDFPNVQHAALQNVLNTPKGNKTFKHVIIDEYQDTNPIQEQLIFALAAGHKNICVVGDDDQSLYRFRGATVVNFVMFPERCMKLLGIKPQIIKLVKNFRSLPKIVRFYNDFIQTGNWRQGKTIYRIEKDILAERKGVSISSVMATAPGPPEDVSDEIAKTVDSLIRSKKVSDPNQIAFLFPSLGSPHVAKMRTALEKCGYQVYAPRAGRFMETPEAIAMFGVMLHIIGKPTRDDTYNRGEYKSFHDWIDRCYSEAGGIIKSDIHLKEFVSAKKKEIELLVNDFDTLLTQCEKHKWDSETPFTLEMRRGLLASPGLSKGVRTRLSSTALENTIGARTKAGMKSPLRYVINRVTSLDWDMLDLFYRICGFEHFKTLIDLAEKGEDEGPICNLSLISKYVDKYMDVIDSYVITAFWLKDGLFSNRFFGHYFYVLYRKSESEHEDADDPFPKGRIPFITIHQSKGLEFPIVVLANPRKAEKPHSVEILLKQHIKRFVEPDNLIPHFDVMRMFYVALSRAQNLLLVAHYKGSGQSMHPSFSTFLDDPSFPRINGAALKALPAAEPARSDLPTSYSYTMDYLGYQTCPRKYMFFRHYGFTPSRTLTAFFGSLVHQTLEDLHNFIISKRGT